MRLVQIQVRGYSFGSVLCLDSGSDSGLVSVLSDSEVDFTQTLAKKSVLRLSGHAYAHAVGGGLRSQTRAMATTTGTGKGGWVHSNFSLKVWGYVSSILQACSDPDVIETQNYHKGEALLCCCRQTKQFRGSLGCEG